MNTFNVTELEPDNYFTDTLIIDKSFLLLDRVLPVTNSLLRHLLEWEFRQVLSEGIETSEEPSLDEGSVAKKIENPAKKTQNFYEQIINEVGSPNNMSESNKLVIVQAVYNEYVNYINNVYTTFVTHKSLPYEEIYSHMQNLCEFIKDNRTYVMRVQPSQAMQDKVFLVSHAMRSTVIAINIGIQLNMPDDKLIELAVACLLHEVGMIKLPPQVYYTNKPLTAAEKNSIFTHPVISYNILKDYKFPLNICLAALEHHEKENGAGYPRKVNGQQISLFAKIIAVACSFEAITAKRHYKEATSAPDAMLELLKHNGVQYDSTVLKALMHSISMYPVGTYVLLSDGQAAQVTDVNPSDPKNPIVQIYGKVHDNGEPIVLTTNETTLRIVRAMTQKELTS